MCADVDTGCVSVTNGTEGTADAGFPEEIAPRAEDDVCLKRPPSGFYGTGVAEPFPPARNSAAAGITSRPMTSIGVI